MRKDFAKRLYEIMKDNPDVWLVSADLGFGLWDKIREDYPDRFLNTGASEQAASDICVGLALSGKIPVMYSITPFLLYRCFETWRTYVDHERIKVILVGSGRNDDYEVDGYSHFAGDDYSFMNNFKNIVSYWPPTNEEAIKSLNEAVADDRPYYINLTR